MRRQLQGLRGPRGGARRWGPRDAPRACAVLAIGLLATVPAAAAPQTRTSEPTALALTPREAWRSEGLRVVLRGGAEWLVGLGDVPGGSGIGFGLAPSLRMSRYWSVGLTAHYVRLRDLPSAGLSGLRYSVGLGPTLHLGPLGIGLGLGLSGLLVDWRPPEGGRAYRIAHGTCDAQGGHLRAAASYLFLVGDTFATGPLVAVEGSAVRCAAVTSTAAGSGPLRPALPWWWQTSFTAAWSFAWR